jgi:polygalacturonase
VVNRSWPRLLAALALLCLTATSAYAEKVCAVQAYGAKGDGVTNEARAIQAAIDDCAAHHGTVQLGGAAKFVSGPVTLKSNITLRIARGTTLQASPDHNQFPEREQFRQPGRQPFLSAYGAENITIRGGGVIDGNGASWWDDRIPGHTRPRLIVFDHCRHMLMENITVQNSPMWQIVPYYSDDLTFRNMKVLAPEHSHNTDGIDPFSSSHVLIDHVLIDTGDDNVAVKSGQPGSTGPDTPTHDVTVRDCTFLHGHGLSIGSEIAGGVQHVLGEHITFSGTDNGIRIKSNRDRGNDIHDITYRDIRMQNVKTPILISMFYPNIPDSIHPAPVTRLTPHVSNIRIENVTATGAKDAAVIVGLPESPMRNLTLSHVSIQAQNSARIEYADVHAIAFVVKPRRVSVGQ